MQHAPHVIGSVLPERAEQALPALARAPAGCSLLELRADLVYRFRVLVKTADSALRQGMPVTVRIPAGAGDVASAK